MSHAYARRRKRNPGPRQMCAAHGCILPGSTKPALIGLYVCSYHAATSKRWWAVISQRIALRREAFVSLQRIAQNDLQTGSVCGVDRRQSEDALDWIRRIRLVLRDEILRGVHDKPAAEQDLPK